MHDSRQQSRNRGFTLVEIFLGIAIVGVALAVAVPAYSTYVERTRVARAVLDIADLQVLIQQHRLETGELPDSLAEIKQDQRLDPWGRPYQYTNLSNLKGKGKARKDKNLVPINSDFDLWSMGKDGKSVSPLTAKASRDDIVRANDGRFIGLASDYSP